jgi:hypothetical protein
MARHSRSQSLGCAAMALSAMAKVPVVRMDSSNEKASISEACDET